VVVPITYDLKCFFWLSTLDWPAMYWRLRTTGTLALGKPVDEWRKHLYATKQRRFRIYNWARFILLGHAAILVISLLNGWWWLPMWAGTGSLSATARPAYCSRPATTRRWGRPFQSC